MKAIDALLELLGRVGACRGAAFLVNDEDLRQWPGTAVKAMKTQRLIVKARPASSVICSGCEEICVMPVHTLPTTTGKPLSFIVCDKRSDINRVPVPAGRLIQWQCNADLICGFVASSLGMRGPQKRANIADRWEIGMVFGDKHSQMLCLDTSGTLTLIVGNSKVPLAEFIELHDGRYSIDAMPIRQLADATTTSDNRYTPSTVRIEARKLKTKTMYESWRKEYRAWRRIRPGMSDVWYSRQIAKMDIAQNKAAETIRKKMKS